MSNSEALCKGSCSATHELWARLPCDDAVAGYRATSQRVTGTSTEFVPVETGRPALDRLVEEQARAAFARWLRFPSPPESSITKPLAPDLAEQRKKNQAAIRLLEEWLADESRHDEENWPLAKRAIEENRLSYRKRFRE